MKIPMHWVTYEKKLPSLRFFGVTVNRVHDFVIELKGECMFKIQTHKCLNDILILYIQVL